MKTVLAAVIFLLGGIVSSEAARCAGSGRYRLAYDGNWPMFIKARAGTTCEATFGSVGGSNLTFKRLFLVKSPLRGRINLREGGYYIYTAPSSPARMRSPCGSAAARTTSPAARRWNIR